MAMNLYGVKKREGDKMPARMVMLEAQNDFDSRSLMLQQLTRGALTFGDRLKIDIMEHNEILSKIIQNIPISSYKGDYTFNDGDPSIDPMTFIEKDNPDTNEREITK